MPPFDHAAWERSWAASYAPAAPKATTTTTTASRRGRSPRGTWVLGSALLLGLMVAPFAGAAGEGNALRLGERNPTGKGNPEVSRETQLIAQTAKNTYGTRQSNKGEGGGAIYGCRAKIGADAANPEVTTACIRANNLSTGEAFQFQSGSGTIVGVIQVGNSFANAHPESRPFITNATAVATGLNADQVDGLSANEIVAQAQRAPSSPASAYARVNATGADTVDNDRSQNVVDANVTHPATGVYCFNGLPARPKNAVATLDTVAGEISANVKGDDADCPGNEEIAVRTFNSAGVLTDAAFYITINA